MGQSEEEGEGLIQTLGEECRTLPRRPVGADST